MRIGLAPNAFRGSLSALDAVKAIATGLRQSKLNLQEPLEIVPLPLADGGDGTLDVLVDALGGDLLTVSVTGPDHEPVRAQVGLLADGKTAVIEMARASGVELLPLARRNPLITTSYGTGELIDAAFERGYRRFIVGIGGSATVDGGAGCLQALGVRLLDDGGQEIPHGGGGLMHLRAMDAQTARDRFRGTEFMILCDVTNPLYGRQGAAYVFGPQKGATPAMVEVLDQGLQQFASVIKRDLGVDIAEVPGAGAAGGIGAGLMACLEAKLVSGASTLIDVLGYRKRLVGLDLLITGEGKLDPQTEGGKAVQRISEAARALGVPVVAFAGTLEADRQSLHGMGIDAAWSICPGPVTLADALTHAAEWLTRAATTLGDLLALRR